MKVLVTGGAGFIGSNFIRHLLGSDRSVEIINFDKLTYAGNPESLADIASTPPLLLCSRGHLRRGGGELTFLAKDSIPLLISPPRRTSTAALRTLRHFF